MSLIPNDLSSKLLDLSRLLRQSSESTAQINRLREQLAAAGPNVQVAQRLDALHSRAIQLSCDEQNLTASCVGSLETLLRSVSSGGKRGAGAENGRGDGSGSRAAATAAGSEGGVGGSSLASGGSKGKRARATDGDERRRAPSPSPGEFPDSSLELVTGDAAEEPLCGAVRVAPSFVAPLGSRVVARLSGPKVIPQLWSIGIVTRFIEPKSKYVLRDEEIPGAHNEIKSHTITSKYVVPMPISLPAPSAQSSRNSFSRGAHVLALYPGDSRFVKGVVSAAPGDSGGRRSYVVTFDPAELNPGEAPSAAVPASYIVALPACLVEQMYLQGNGG
ncbi:hypothetical protein T492DRAFT_915296 [Pavlovales sp. CCMP2436]|nr:hypothetical protein T492DRAFT_915296 [Pavlovales sp. CCMP2436]